MTIRQPCPPGACVCEREQLLQAPGADLRILNLTRQEEKKLIERLEDLKSLQDLERMQQLMHQQLGIRVHIAPGHTEVKSMRGIQIVIDDLPIDGFHMDEAEGRLKAAGLGDDPYDLRIHAVALKRALDQANAAH